MELDLPSASSGARSALLNTRSSGTAPAWISPSTVCTASIWASGSTAAGVDQVDEQVGLGHHLEGALEGLDQAVGQSTHEPDRVGQEDGLAAGKRQAPGGRVERREEPVLDEHAGVVSRLSNVDLPALV